MRRSSTILLLKAKCRKTCLEKHLATFCLASPKYTLTDCVRYKPGNTSAVNFVVSFAVSKLDPARPSGQWSGLCTSDAADAKMPNSTVHLQYVSETFASLADALMVVKDGQNSLHFPVHTVSGYSPLLCDVLQQMDLPATAAARGSKAKLFMHGDSPAEVQAALDCIYKPFATENAGTRGVYLLTDSQQPHLIRFAHKYGMSTILAEVEAGLLAHFSTAWTNEQDDQRHPIRNDGVIRVAAAAEGCSQQKLLAYCELHIVLNFAHLEGQSLIAEQLSCQSLMRIAKGLAHCHKHDIGIMDTVLSRFSQEEKQQSFLPSTAMQAVQEVLVRACSTLTPVMCTSQSMLGVIRLSVGGHTHRDYAKKLKKLLSRHGELSC